MLLASGTGQRILACHVAKDPGVDVRTGTERRQEAAAGVDDFEVGDVFCFQDLAQNLDGKSVHDG